MSETARIVKAILSKRKWTQARLGEELGVSQPTIQRWLGGASPDTENRDNLMALLDSSDDFAELSGRRRTKQPTGDIPNLTIHAGLGSGGLQHIEVDSEGTINDPSYLDGFWTFPDSIRSGLGNMKSTHALPVKGDSMEPTLVGGSVVFVDTTHTMPSPPDLYAVDYGDGLMIKRIELIPRTDQVRVISDNDKYSNYEMPRDDLRVYGRVLASFQWRN